MTKHKTLFLIISLKVLHVKNSLYINLSLSPLKYKVIKKNLEIRKTIEKRVMLFSIRFSLYFFGRNNS